MFKKIISSILAIVMMASIGANVFAEEKESLMNNFVSMSEDEINQQIIRNIDVFNQYFDENGITIESELLKEKARIEDLLKTEKNEQEKNRLKNLINAYDKMIM